MTGYGRGEAVAQGWKAEVEISSVNRRQFDVRVNLPRSLSAMESLLYGLVHDNVSRGSISVTVRMSTSASQQEGVGGVDGEAAESVISALRTVARELGLVDDLAASHLLAVPDVIQRKAAPEDVEKAWPIVQHAAKAALRRLVGMRKEEGTALGKDIHNRLSRLKRVATRIAKVAPSVVDRYRKKLRQRLKMVDLPLSADDPSLLRELVMFADRSDIAEELVRLESHFSQADKLLAGSKPVGRALDFLCQEMFREINTIGSKGNDTVVAREVIRFKAELEQVREQVQNLE